MNTTATAIPETLRARIMVDRTKKPGYARTGHVEEAMWTVPRHLFVPDAEVADAYTLTSR